jgi:hypothetical protein
MAVVAVLAMLVWAGPAMAWQWAALSVPEMSAHGGATHMAEFQWSDFTQTSTNTAQTFTNTIPAKRSLECIAMMLDTAYTIGTTNYTDSCLLKIGDGSDDDLFLTSTELASDGTEVFIKFGPPYTYTAASTPTFTTLAFGTNVTVATTNLITLQAGATNVSQTVTNAVVKTVTLQTSNGVTGGTIATTTTAGELGRKLYATQGSLVFTFTPDANQALDSFTAGKVRVYFRMLQSNR